MFKSPSSHVSRTPPLPPWRWHWLQGQEPSGPVPSMLLSVDFVNHFSRVSYAILGDPGMALARRGAPDMSALRPYEHCFCSVGRMQPEDLQQPGVCSPPGSVREPGLRGRLPADAHVHHPHELRQRLGGRVQVRSGGRRSRGPGSAGHSEQQSRGSSETS